MHCAQNLGPTFYLFLLFLLLSISSPIHISPSSHNHRDALPQQASVEIIAYHQTCFCMHKENIQNDETLPIINKPKHAKKGE
jgi:hypothetical protein